MSSIRDSIVLPKCKVNILLTFYVQHCSAYSRMNYLRWREEFL
jgi:hypothetical protein